ncbi:MAG: flagellar basal body-associated FliL family protein [Desulfobacteraceae bacterium]|nr:flagellar basal body-associated FliL family protein [Desulfobacteraceae bacterium]
MSSLKKEENAIQSLDNLDESEDKEKKAFFQKKNTKDKLIKQVWKKKAFFYFVTGTLVLVGLSLYPLLKNRQENVWIPQLKWFPVQNYKSIKFEPFIIPFREHGKFTYISLSISFELPNKELMDEMIEKNNWIRGIIYNILSDNIYVLENVSSLMKLKRFIINGVNNVLTAGKVDKAIITDFSTV